MFTNTANWKHNGLPWKKGMDPELCRTSAVWTDEKAPRFIATVEAPAGFKRPGPNETEDNCRLIAMAPRLYQFAADYLWSEHGECPQHREACPQSDEQLAEIAREILAIVENPDHKA